MRMADRRDLGRFLVPMLAAATVVLAAVVDVSSTWRTLILVAAGVAVALSSVGRALVPLTAVAATGVTVAVWDGRLEPGLFLVSVLALVVASSSERLRVRIVLSLLLLLVPLVVMLFAPDTDNLSPVWFLGIGFPLALGAGLRQQLASAEALVQARLALAENAMAEERRRIARDVHDLVGHGLAAALLQIASARHVLRRDVEAADKALAAAERAGRASMRELRATLSVLRDGDAPDASSLPGAADIESLAERARVEGLQVSYRLVGDTRTSGRSAGLALYRIAQEALSNAQRHAPHAATEVTLECSSEAHCLRVLSRGACAAPHDGPTFGIRGMQERAAGVGGLLSAGMTTDGWLVDASLPSRPVEEDS